MSLRQSGYDAQLWLRGYKSYKIDDEEITCKD